MENIYALENRLLSEELVNFEDEMAAKENRADFNQDSIIAESPVAQSSDQVFGGTSYSSPLQSPSHSVLQKLGSQRPSEVKQDLQPPKPLVEKRRGSLFKQVDNNLHLKINKIRLGAKTETEHLQITNKLNLKNSLGKKP